MVVFSAVTALVLQSVRADHFCTASEWGRSLCVLPFRVMLKDFAGPGLLHFVGGTGCPLDQKLQ